MRYYRALTDGESGIGPIRVSWLWNGYYQIAARSRDARITYGYGCGYYYLFWQRGGAFPDPKDFGECVEITEEEAMQLDPGMFEDQVIWNNYEDFKPHDAEWEAKKQPHKKNKSKSAATLW